jgi:hypothetical protein
VWPVACLIIDPQNDFHSGGSLAVPGADAARGRTHQLRLLVRMSVAWCSRPSLLDSYEWF